MARRRSTKSRRSSKKKSRRSSARRGSARTKKRRSASRTRRSSRTSARSRSASRRSRARGMTRKEFLKTAGVGAAALGAAAVGLGKVARAQAPSASTEILYLSDCLDHTPRNGTKLFRVNLDSITMRANLELVYTFPTPKYDVVAAIACTANGERIYAIDNNSRWFGYYDITIDAFTDIGQVDIGGIALLAFGTDGKLYASSSSTDTLYTVNLGNGALTTLGGIYKDGVAAKAYQVNVDGADLAFGADGTLYLWANSSRTNAPSGLYALDYPNANGTIVKATYLGGTGKVFTGFAIRANGYGDLVGSANYKAPQVDKRNSIVVVSKSDGSFGNVYNMYEDGSPYQHEWGDMSAGPLALCTRTIGYWKNHPWNGMAVTICGETVDETFGKTVLKSAKGKNFSMFFAQLIAAKLNVNNATGIPTIDEAEAWLCDQGLGIDDYKDPFKSKAQKRDAVEYWEALDLFNNSFPCEE